MPLPWLRKLENCRNRRWRFSRAPDSQIGGRAEGKESGGSATCWVDNGDIEGTLKDVESSVRSKPKPSFPMNVNFALIASGMVQDQGKWTVVGIFQVIYAKTFPVTHAPIVLLIRVEGHPREAGTHEIRLDFVNELGERVEGTQSASVEFRIDPKQVISGASPHRDIDVKFPGGLRIPKEGNYDFAIHIDDTYLASVPLYARLVDDQGRIV